MFIDHLKLSISIRLRQGNLFTSLSHFRLFFSDVSEYVMIMIFFPKFIFKAIKTFLNLTSWQHPGEKFLLLKFSNCLNSLKFNFYL